MIFVWEFWRRFGAEEVRYAIRLLDAAQEDATSANVRKVLASAPADSEQWKDPDWAWGSYCMACLDAVFVYNRRRFKRLFQYFCGVRCNTVLTVGTCGLTYRTQGPKWPATLAKRLAVAVCEFCPDGMDVEGTFERIIAEQVNRR